MSKQNNTAAVLLGYAIFLISQGVYADKPAQFLTQPLVFSAAENSAQPSVVADTKRGQFVVSWQNKDAAGCSSLKLATLKPDPKIGLMFGAISQAGQGCDWFVNWADFPSVGIADNGDWLTYWLQKSGNSTYAYDIQMVRSHDQGRSWQPPFKVHSDNTQTEHGFVSLAPAGGDKMLAVWLDGRKMASEKSNADDAHASHTKIEHAHGDAMTLRSAVLGRAGSISAEAQIDANVCTCCSTDLVRASAGANALYTLVFRDRSEAEIRDIGLAHFHAGKWKSVGTVHADNWKISGCPVNGPSIASSGNDTLVVWATMQGDALSVRASNLSGKPGEFLNLETGAGVLGRVDAAPWGKTNWLVSWLGAGEAGRATLYLAELDAKLNIVRRQALLDVAAGRNIGMPRLATLQGKFAVLLWTEATERNGSSPTQTRIAGLRVLGQ